jgi:hypothetical protein
LPDDLRARFVEVQRAIRAAAGQAGRDPASVRIVAVTKTFPPETLAAALAAGLGDVGENYVQEAAAKRAALGPAGRWHLIGGLQRNKVRPAVALFDYLHTVDSAALVAAVGTEAARAGRSLHVLIQLNLTSDGSRRGLRPEEALGVAAAVLTQPALALEGLMTIPLAGARPEDVRPSFRLLREVRDSIAGRLGVELPHLSMGMSDDFTVAVEEGATMLRLGRALFGARGPSSWRPGSSAGGEGS